MLAANPKEPTPRACSSLLFLKIWTTPSSCYVAGAQLHDCTLQLKGFPSYSNPPRRNHLQRIVMTSCSPFCAIPQ